MIKQALMYTPTPTIIYMRRVYIYIERVSGRKKHRKRERKGMNDRNNKNMKAAVYCKLLNSMKTNVILVHFKQFAWAIHIFNQFSNLFKYFCHYSVVLSEGDTPILVVFRKENNKNFTL